MQVVKNNHSEEPKSLELLESQAEPLVKDFAQRFRRLGEIFLEIKNRKLYRDAGYPTFEQYMKERWGWSRGRAYQIINAALVVLGLEEYFPPECLPKSEFVVRPLVPLEPDEQIEVWAATSPNATKEETEEGSKAYKIVGVYPLIGSKWKMSSAIAARAKEIEFEKYLEPFVGSGAVFFRLVDQGLIKKPAVLNDLNQLAIALFHTIRDRPIELQQRLALVPYARVERSQPEPPADAEELEKAVWWAVHTFQGYVGHKTKDKGWSVDHTSHAGRHEKWNKFKEQIPVMGKVLCDRAAFECMDGLEFIKKYTRKSDRHLLYVDPPYFGFEKTYYACFDRHQELAELLAEVPAAGVFVTYYDGDELRQLYPESRWNWELFERWSTCTADGVRQRRDEVLLTRKEQTLIAIAAPQIEKAIALSPAPITQSQPGPQAKSKVESWAEEIRAKLQPDEIQQLIILLKLE